MTFSPTGSTLYLDGAAQGNATGGALSDGIAVPLSIGAWAGDGAGFMSGSLDEVAVWDQPLTRPQITKLADATLGPLDLTGQSGAVYYSGNGRLATGDERRKTVLPAGPSTYYFRKPFTFSDSPANASLSLDLAVDDGAVVYLNGKEVYRQNMPTGPVSYATPAAPVVAPTPLLTGIVLSPASLLVGTNVLAIEVHQAAAPDPGMMFGAALNVTVAPPGLAARIPDHLVFNEISGAGDGPMSPRTPTVLRSPTAPW